MADDDQKPTDAEVLTNPDAFTVAEVVAVLKRSSADDVAAAQGREQDGQARKGITEYEAPDPDLQAGLDAISAADAPIEEAKYARERILDFREGPAIVDLPWPIIVGALDGDDSTEFTRTEVQAKAQAFLSRVVPQEA